MQALKGRFLFLFFLIIEGGLVQAQETNLETSIDSLIGIAQFEEAKKLLHQLPTKQLFYHERMAQVALAMGESPLAIKSYQALRSLDSSNLKYLNSLARLEAQRSNYLKASQYYRELMLQDSTNAYYWKQLGALSLKRAHLPLALAYFSTAYALNSADIEVIAQLSKLYLEMRLFTNADSLIADGLNRDSANAALWMLNCQSAYRQKEYKRMSASADALLNLQIDSSAFYLRHKGIAAYHLGAYNKTITCLERLLQAEGKSELTAFYLGMAYRATNELELAKEYLQTSVDEAISDQIGTYYLNLALVCEEQKDYAQAIPAYQKAYQAKALNVINYYLACCYDAYYKDKGVAIEYFERYLAQSEAKETEYVDYAQKRVSALK